MPRRYDLGEFDSPQRLDNGFLRCDGKITRVGVFSYLQSDGTTRRELRLPSEVFKVDSLESFNDVPLTNEHPKEKLNAFNTRKFAVGHVTSPRQVNQFVAAKVFVNDYEAIAAIEEGKTQLSCGYDCDLEQTPGVTSGVDGVPDGVRYDAVQRNIVGNHVALVNRARAGKDVALHLDAEDAVMVMIGNKDQQQQSDRKATLMKTVRIDGVDYEVSEQAFQAISKLVARADAADEAKKLAEQKVSEANARADKAEEELVKEKKLREDAASPEKVQAAVKARVALERTAEKVLAEDASKMKLDEMSEAELKRAVVLKISPTAQEKYDSSDEAYQQARFDAALESFETASKDEDKSSNTPAINKLRAPHVDADSRFDSKSARQRMLDRHHKLGVEPVSATVPANG